MKFEGQSKVSNGTRIVPLKNMDRRRLDRERIPDQFTQIRNTAMIDMQSKSSIQTPISTQESTRKESLQSPNDFIRSRFSSSGSITPNIGILSLRHSDVVQPDSHIDTLDYRVPMNSPNVLDVPNRDNPQPFYCCDIFFNNYFEYQNHTQEVHAQSHYTMEGSTLNNQYQPDFEYTTADLTGFSPQSSYHSSFDRTYASSGYGSNHTGPAVMDQFHITPASSAVPSRTGSPVSGYSVSVLPEQNYNTSPFMGLLYPTMNQGNSHLGVRYPLQSLIPPINAIQFRNEPELSNTQSFQQEFDDYFCDTDPVQKNDSFGIYPIDNSHQRPLSESGSAKDTFIKSPMMPAHAPDLGSSSNRGNKITKKTKSIQRMDLKSEEVTSLQSFDGKPHKCTIDNCGKLYKTQNGLKYHRVYHHGALPSSAPSSPKASEPIEFDFPDNVRPSYVHPMFRRYKCLVGVCDKKYKNMSGLRYHIANAHPEISEDIQKQYLNSSKERGNNGEFAEFPESLAPEVE